ncbi:hypothetical protein QNM99_29650 [Pseudomonas sp. PCH446]
MNRVGENSEKCNVVGYTSIMSKKHHALSILARIYNSVLTRLLVLALCIVVSGAILRYYVLTNFLREDLSAVVEGQQLALATYVAHDVDSKIIRRRLFIEHLAASVPFDLLARPEKLRDWLKELSPYQTLLSIDIFIVDASGRRVAGYPDQEAASDSDYVNRDYVQAGLADRPFIGRPIESPSSAEPILPISAPIRNAAGEVQGVVVGMMSLAAPGFLDSLLQSRGERQRANSSWFFRKVACRSSPRRWDTLQAGIASGPQYPVGSSHGGFSRYRDNAQRAGPGGGPCHGHRPKHGLVHCCQPAGPRGVFNR